MASYKLVLLPPVACGRKAETAFISLGAAERLREGLHAVGLTFQQSAGLPSLWVSRVPEGMLCLVTLERMELPSITESDL